MIKRIISCLLCLCVCLIACGSGNHGYSLTAQIADSNVFEMSEYFDVEGHPAKDAVERWSEYGIINGYGGYFRPDGEITRAEVSAIIVRLAGYNRYPDSEPHDVRRDAWYYDAVTLLYAAGVMRGFEGYLRPEDKITREEAITVIARTFELPEMYMGGAFEDETEIHEWAAGYVWSMWSMGYLDFFGNNIEPQRNITRAETVMIIDHMFKGFFSSPGIYSGDIGGNVIIRSPGITLKDMRVGGDVYVVEGVGEGWYTINGGTVIDGIVHERAGRLNPYPHIDPRAPMVAFTFDDGPGKATEKILDILEKYNAKASFCVVGYLIEDNASSLKRAVSLGCEIASHTWKHTSITSMGEARLIKDCEDIINVIYEAAGVRPAFLRPPYGNYNSSTSAILKKVDMATLFWSVDPSDWSHRDALTTYNRVMRDIRDGSIILLHDSVPSTATAMEMLVPELIEKGYQLVTATEMLTYSDIGFEPGRVYISRDNYK